MTDRDIQKDRLIEIVKDSLMKHIDKTCSLAEKITDDLLANGVIVLPCKVGDKIYITTCDSPTRIEETRVSQIKIKVKESGKISYRISAPCVYDTWGDAHWTFCAFEFGETVFLTKEEAEKALKERNKNESIS